MKGVVCALAVRGVISCSGKARQFARFLLLFKGLFSSGVCEGEGGILHSIFLRFISVFASNAFWWFARISIITAFLFNNLNLNLSFFSLMDELSHIYGSFSEK